MSLPQGHENRFSWLGASKLNEANFLPSFHPSRLVCSSELMDEQQEEEFLLSASEEEKIQ